MPKKLLLLLATLVPSLVVANTSTISGTFTDAHGVPVNGSIYLQLPVPAVDTTTNTAISVVPFTYRIINGVLASGPPVFDVATMQPQNLYYTATLYDSAGTKIFQANYAITGATYNLSAAIPTNVTTNNISYVSPAVTNGANVFCCTQTFQGQIVSTITTGTAPFSINSTTLVPNLNVNLLNGVTISGTPAAGFVPVATSPTAASWQAPVASSGTSLYPNNGTGTVAGLLVRLTGAPSTVVTVGLADITGSVGVCVSGCGTTGTATVGQLGEFSCTFDGATTANDYVTISNSVQGNCHDFGATVPVNLTSVQIIGRVQSTNGGSGLYTVTFFSPIINSIPLIHVATNNSTFSCAGDQTVCTESVSWGFTWPDTNYTAMCMGTGQLPTSGANSISWGGSTAQSTTTITVAAVANGTSGGSYAGVTCWGIHN